MSYNKLLNLIVLIPVVFILLSGVSASAENADKGNAVKGIYPAQSIYIDKSLYTDASMYDNSPVSDHIVKVGLCYGSEAVHEANIQNTASGEFIIGYFNADRVFTPLQNINSSSLRIDLLANEINGTPDAEDDTDDFKPGFRILDGDDGELLYTAADGDMSIALISDDGASISFLGGQYYGGFEFLLVGDAMTVVNYVPLETYVKGVVPYEMSPYFPFEALRAQAVCARTYAVYNYDGFSEYGFDLTDDTRSQVYGGEGRADQVTDSAVDTTAGLIVRYQGQPCEVYYSSSFGGASESGANVFDSDRPYLSGKADPFEKAVDFDLKTWHFSKSAMELTELLQSRNYDIGTVISVTPVRSATDNVIALIYEDEQGKTVCIEGRRCYTMLGLHSCRFEIIKDGENFGFYGSGWGHNCGMSQWGAFAMAEIYGYNYEDIIRFYFTGAYIA